MNIVVGWEECWTGISKNFAVLQLVASCSTMGLRHRLLAVGRMSWTTNQHLRDIYGRTLCQYNVELSQFARVGGGVCTDIFAACTTLGVNLFSCVSQKGVVMMQSGFYSKGSASAAGVADFLSVKMWFVHTSR